MEKIKIDSALKVLFYLYIIFLPLQDIKLSLSATGKNFLLSDIIFLPLFLLWVFKSFFHNKSSTAKTDIFYPIILFLIVFSLSTIFSKNYLRSSFDLVGLIYLILLFLLSVNVLKDEKIIFTSIKLWVMTALSVIFIGLFAFLISTITSDYNSNSFLMYDPTKKSLIPFPRINSTFQTQEMLISYMIVTMGFLFILSEKNQFWLSKIPVVILGVILALSRGLIGFVATWILCIYIKKGNILRRFILIPSIAVFLSLLISIYISSKWIIFPFNLEIDEQSERLKMSFGISPGQREIFNKTAIEMWKDNPLLGVGPGEFTYQFKNYANSDMYRNSWNVLGKITEVDPHSTYYGALSETGVLGFLSIIFLFIKVLYQVSKYISDKTVFYLFASLVGLLVNGFISDILMFRHLWLLLGFLYAYLLLEKQ